MILVKMQPYILLLLCIAACSALPANLFPTNDWMSLSDSPNLPRFNPSVDNVYHLFTRNNPTTSQPLIRNAELLSQTNYDNQKRTIVLIHGQGDSAIADFNTVLVPVFLAAEDVNVIVLDWSSGAGSDIYELVNVNCVLSATAVAEFLTWLNEASGSTIDRYHIVGHGVGAHQAGIVGRLLGGKVPYISGLDPSFNGWYGNALRFQADDAVYTEVIHTNGLSYVTDLAQVDFYPNGGTYMPGCSGSACDHARAVHYFAESIATGGFTGIQCNYYQEAVLELCTGTKTLQMGGLTPKTGETGIYSLATNEAPPFSQG